MSSSPSSSRAISVAPATAPGIRNTATSGTRNASTSGTPNPSTSIRRDRSSTSRSASSVLRRWSATAVSSSVRKYPETQNPMAGTTVCPTTGMNPRANSRIPYRATRPSTFRLSRAEIHSSRPSESPDSGTAPPSVRSTCSERDS